MSAVPIQSTHLNPAIEKILSRCTEIAVLPQVVYKIMEMTGSDESSCADIERAIAVDPGFSTKVLSLANSAYYNLPRKVTSIREAVMFVGFRGLREMAMNVGVYNMFVGKTDKESLRRRAWWRHSIDTAICCSWLVSTYKSVPADQAYTCGLLHYIGKTILDRSAPDLYEQVVRLEEMGKKDCEAERIVFSCDHVEVACALGSRWAFPEVLQEGLKYLEPPPPGDAFARLKACTALGHHIAKLAVVGVNSLEENAPSLLPEWALEQFGIDPSGAQGLIEGGAAAIAAAASLTF